MRNAVQDELVGAGLRYRIGDRVRVVQGPDTGRKGVITEIYPTHARPYRVQLGDGWYVHFAEDRLALVREELQRTEPALP